MITTFEDIEAWQKARELTREIYALSNDGSFARDFGLRDQIRRASVSIMSNIAEGFERGGDKEFFRTRSLRAQRRVPQERAPVTSWPAVSLDRHLCSGVGPPP